MEKQLELANKKIRFLRKEIAYTHKLYAIILLICLSIIGFQKVQYTCNMSIPTNIETEYSEDYSNAHYGIGY